MARRVKRLIRDLSGRGSSDLLALLLHQIQATIEGGQLAKEAAEGQVSTVRARDAMTAIEHRGDEARRQLVSSMSTSLVTPFDREDVFRMSRSIDDVLDNLQDFVRELDLFQTPGTIFTPVLDAVLESLELLHSAIEVGVTSAPLLETRTLAAKKSCNEIRRSYQQQIHTLLQGTVSTEMLRRRELLRRLDVVGLRLGESVDSLADAAVKRTL